MILTCFSNNSGKKIIIPRALLWLHRALSTQDFFLPTLDISLSPITPFTNYQILVPEDLYDEIGAPLNKNGIGASIASHPQVLKAYYSQFQQDFTTFLKCRSHEVVSNGYMILATYCRPSIEPFETRLFNFVFQALACLVSKGAIEEEDLDTFNLPIYFPCKEEINEMVNKEPFEVEYLEVMQDDERNGAKDDDPRTIAEFFAKTGRSITESLVSTHFGEQVWDQLYGLLYQVVFKHLERNTGPLDMFNIIIVLKKK